MHSKIATFGGDLLDGISGRASYRQIERIKAYSSVLDCSKNMYGIRYMFPSIIGAVVWAEPTSQWIGAQFESVGLVWWVI